MNDKEKLTYDIAAKLFEKGVNMDVIESCCGISEEQLIAYIEDTNRPLYFYYLGIKAQNKNRKK